MNKESKQIIQKLEKEIVKTDGPNIGNSPKIISISGLRKAKTIINRHIKERDI